MSKEQIENWLLSQIEKQISKANAAMDDVTFALRDNNFEEASKQHRQVDYWLSRIRNTQRLVDDLE